jgi:plastocyanin
VPPGPPAPAAPPRPHTAPDLAVIEIRSDGFHPADVVIRAGGSVSWVNRDSIPHAVRIASAMPGKPDGVTAPIPPGGSVGVGLSASRAYSEASLPSWRGTVTCIP